MTEMEYQEVLEHVKVLAGTCYSMVTKEEIDNIIHKVNPHISVYQYDKLIRECKENVQIVSKEKKREMLQIAYPEEYKESRPDPALIDKFFCVLVQREIDSEVKSCWEDALGGDIRCHKIKSNRLTSSPERLAEELDVSLEELYYLEREMIKLYYTISDSIIKSKSSL